MGSINEKTRGKKSRDTAPLSPTYKTIRIPNFLKKKEAEKQIN